MSPSPAVAASASLRWLNYDVPAQTFYFDSRDAVDNGSGKVASLTDRVLGMALSPLTATLINRSTVNGVVVLDFGSTSGNVGNQLVSADQTATTSLFGGTNAFTFSFRAYPLTFVAVPAYLGGCNDSGGSARLLCGKTNTTGGLSGFLRNATLNSSSGALTANAWQTVFYVYSGTQTSVYRDTTNIQAATTNSNSIGTAPRFVLGGADAYAASSNWIGYIGNWRGWTSALTAAQRTAVVAADAQVWV